MLTVTVCDPVPTMDPAGQADYGIRFGWGPEAARALARGSRATVVVDVLSFMTSVDIAVSRGAIVHPLRWNDERAAEVAAELKAELAVGRGDADNPNGSPWSLSPSSLLDIPAGTRILLPSPNGATVTLAAADDCSPVFGSCLRNASAVAEAAASTGGPVAVIAAGERWPDGQLRVAVEDLIGAGAVIGALVAAGSAGSPSPEARTATAAHAAMAQDLVATLTDCVSGRELIARHFGADVLLAAEADVSTTVPVLEGGAFSASSRWR